MKNEPESTRGALVLIVDDTPANLNLLTDALGAAGYNVAAAPSGEVALKLARMDRPDLILLDILMPGMDGFEICHRLKADEFTRAIPVIFLTAREETCDVVRGFQTGAADYIVKPFQAEEVLSRVATHVRLYRLTRTLLERNEELARVNEELRQETKRRCQAEEALSEAARRDVERWAGAGMIGNSPPFQRLQREIRRLQEFRVESVLILGESGTGKELVARALHYGGSEATRPFVAANCAAIPEELAESFLFGHVRGAFTGAISDHKGVFQSAHGGTLFLDEVGDLSLPIQAKLLRVLEEGQVQPLGSAAPRPVRVRVIAATNAELLSSIEAGRFRKDLYFRLARFTMELPPLRERLDDVPLLAGHFLRSYAAEMGMAPPALHPEAVAALRAYDFPGNVRELKNLMERALIESGGEEIRPVHLRFLLHNNAPAAREGTPNESARSASGRALLTCEERILEFVNERGGINNSECRDLLAVGMHRAWYLLNKLHRAGRLKQDHSGRWAQYRLPVPEAVGATKG
jgi:DNA-binding NtrC family response regulator